MEIGSDTLAKNFDRSKPERKMPENKNLLKSFFGGLMKLFSRSSGQRTPVDGDNEYIRLLEARALHRFASERALDDPQAPVLPKLASALEEFDAATDEPAKALARQNIATAYNDLCHRTYSQQAVNGRTIIDSRDAADEFIARAGLIAFVTLLLAIIPEILSFVLNPDDPEYTYVELANRLNALFWGALEALSTL